ncbi:aminotransferase class V-fold PLP-dependent enzyme [Paraburkholderia madseniana]|uniref:cysteine desulfurase n=1 Tax=Paraburkholderia madseniana TaxID=2599607 RepID=A0A6N6W1V9_9BURK|nr:aminotransferase class V-fold PLP-dependent enzyme [Paraburkholderia madseniana]
MSSSLHYFDYAATTPADPRVITSMVQCLGIDGVFANPASTSHPAGMQARNLVENARAEVARLIGALPDEIVWTSGATESNNLALKGFADSAGRPAHIVTSRLEHKAILDTVASLESRGWAVSYADPDRNGAITVEAIAKALRPGTAIVSLMLVNNEIGTLTDIAAISAIVHSAGALLHVDAAQALGKTPIDVNASGIDLMSISAHKAYGPKGIGALYVSSAVAQRLAPQMHGGGHERGLRSGTLATHQIVGMGAACAIAHEEMNSDTRRIAKLGERLLAGVLPLERVRQNARDGLRIPHTLSLTIDHPGFFPFMLVGDLAVSSTSACNSAAGTPSHVLSAIGLSDQASARTIRLSLGRFTTEEDIDHAITCIRQVVEQCKPRVAAVQASASV